MGCQPSRTDFLADRRSDMTRNSAGKIGSVSEYLRQTQQAGPSSDNLTKSPSFGRRHLSHSGSEFSTMTGISGRSLIRVTLSSDGSMLEVEKYESASEHSSDSDSEASEIDLMDTSDKIECDTEQLRSKHFNSLPNIKLADSAAGKAWRNLRQSISTVGKTGNSQSQKSRSKCERTMKSVPTSSYDIKNQSYSLVPDRSYHSTTTVTPLFDQLRPQELDCSNLPTLRKINSTMCISSDLDCSNCTTGLCDKCMSQKTVARYDESPNLNEFACACDCESSIATSPPIRIHKSSSLPVPYSQVPVVPGVYKSTLLNPIFISQGKSSSEGSESSCGHIIGTSLSSSQDIDTSSWCSSCEEETLGVKSRSSKGSQQDIKHHLDKEGNIIPAGLITNEFLQASNIYDISNCTISGQCMHQPHIESAIPKTSFQSNQATFNSSQTPELSSQNICSKTQEIASTSSDNKEVQRQSLFPGDFTDAPETRC